ncbi:hypothetical protein EUGRSUZ_G00801 [Eucalyptus grandis]|uniref:Uncharacterized protein n=2 Tax=Eucalyptus grandis TaxID=71139 RepID=A0ACC3K3G0_EUCGR|nr:hypothetical protein EUGRSUZ_G00801 [Eucalyptus grandis]
MVMMLLRDLTSGLLRNQSIKSDQVNRTHSSVFTCEPWWFLILRIGLDYIIKFDAESVTLELFCYPPRNVSYP